MNPDNVSIIVELFPTELAKIEMNLDFREKKFMIYLKAFNKNEYTYIFNVIKSLKPLYTNNDTTKLNIYSNNTGFILKCI